VELGVPVEVWVTTRMTVRVVVKVDSEVVCAAEELAYTAPSAAVGRRRRIEKRILILAAVDDGGVYSEECGRDVDARSGQLA
jgi:hypothetical protein